MSRRTAGGATPPRQEVEDLAAWNWTAPSLAYPDHVHARREGAEIVLVVTGNAGGALAGRLGGARMSRPAAVALARFILAGESG